MTGAEICPADHPKKAVRDVLRSLTGQGWRLHKGGHWGKLFCPCPHGGCTTIPVHGTPKNAERHARDILRRARLCPLPSYDPRRSLTGFDRDGNT